MFKQGQIVKSKQRTEKNELFLMVLFDTKPSLIVFNAVVLIDFAGNEEAGLVASNWITNQFELSDWNEFNEYYNYNKN